MRRRNFILPYEPDYVGHREARQRQMDTRAWLRQRESRIVQTQLFKAVESLPLAPDMPARVDPPKVARQGSSEK
jgi:hypothetical protein